jgi:hypothetical protein
MMASLRPAIMMSDVYGPDRIYAPRAHDHACDWLPNDPDLLDSFTGAQLTIAGDMPVICSKGFDSPAGIDLLASAGLALAQNRIHFRAGKALEAMAGAAAHGCTRLVLQHAFPPEALPADRYWIDPALLRYLNNKANLGALAPSGNLPQRVVVDREAFLSGKGQALPIVLKAASDQSSGGGSAITICRKSADLRTARQKFEKCEQIVAEQMLDTAQNPCLNFGVMRSGETRYLGYAEQDVTAEGEHRGNWMHLGSSLPEEVVDPALKVVRQAAEMGYRGFAGVDMVIARDGRIYVLDLNFRSNASTVPVLLAAAIRERLGAVTLRYRRFRGQGDAREMARTAKVFVKDERLIPLALFDAELAGYSNKAPALQALIVGASRCEVLATGKELATSGIV